MITEDQINKAYKSLAVEKSHSHLLTLELADVKNDLANAIAKGLMDGTIEGKNEQLRNAAAKELLSDLFAKVDECQYKYDLSRLNYDLASNEVERLRLIIRLMEVTKEI